MGLLVGIVGVEVRIRKLIKAYLLFDQMYVIVRVLIKVTYTEL